MAEDEALRLNSLISKVIDHTKLDSKAHVLNKERIILYKLLEDVYSKLELKALEKKISFDIQINKSVTIYADPVYIFGVIYNILDNSIKYAGNNTIVEILTEEDESFMKLFISDNGPGIPEEYIPKLFDAFFRVPQGNTHNVKGFGLGLSYALQVMKEHDGRIEVKNNPEAGCTFILSFPKN